MATLAREGSDPILLAGEPSFRLAGLEVTPGLRQVAWPGGSRTLEPRVMQVLVALARARGNIVGRDDLIACCWDGRIVGDSSINRVISLLRSLAAESGAFDIETITKVGYRLKVSGLALAPVDALPLPHPRSSFFTRRRLLAGAGAALAGGAGYLALSGVLSPARREARALYESGLETQRRGGEDNARQAISYFRQAVAKDPEFADAWAGLAYSHYQLVGVTYETAIEERAAAVRVAAQRALRLDPGNRQAVLALALLEPNFRHWTKIERETVAALRQMPDELLLHSRLASIFADTGRWRDAAARAAWVAKREPLVRENQLRLATYLWHSGRPAAARPIYDRALELWPTDSFVWLAQFLFLSLSGDAATALAMAERNAFGLDGASPLPRDIGLQAARALVSRSESDVRATVELILSARQKGEIGSFIAIPYLAALGAVGPAFAVIYDYYFGRRDPVSKERQPLSPMAWRHTGFLFTTAAEALRTDPRFPRLTAAIGLDNYWAQSGSLPDYRRRS